MSQLNIRKLTLYKQGIGYFEREGTLDGSTTTLVVSRENINDTLKSLRVVDRSGGQVLGVDYETPADKEQLLNDLPIKLENRSTMVSLLQSLKGSYVNLNLNPDSAQAGRLIGVEQMTGREAEDFVLLLQNRDDPTQVDVIKLAQIETFSILNERSLSDINFYLDVSQIEQSKATVTIRLSEGSHDLEIAYLSPSPTWRVSYQLVEEGENRARLIGWGIFDNTLDEDLENVELTLISGRPISFEYDLYETYVPSRPQVSDDPMAFENVSSNPAIKSSLSTISHEIRSPVNSIRGFADLLLQGVSGTLNDRQKEDVASIKKGADHLAELIKNLLEINRMRDKGRLYEGSNILVESGLLGDLKVSNAYFMPMLIGNAEPENLTYQVSTPVSVRRRQSAMVPIIEELVAIEEICVYNGRKMPNHPLKVWDLKNTTGKALEKGPVTIVKEGHYIGEGLVRFTGVGDDLQLPFALEFGIVVREKINTEHRDTGIMEVEFLSKERRAEVSRYSVTEYLFTFTSHLDSDKLIYLEYRNPRSGDFFEMAEPALDAAGHSRWPVEVKAQEETTFTVR
ncbi:MAG: histidine kinase dimerization/phospho-acceptor domain-containing protein [Chloroflexota bacterium]